MNEIRCRESGHYWHGEPLVVCESYPPDKGSLWGALACEFECGFDATYNFATDECICGRDSFWAALKNFLIKFGEYNRMPYMWRR